jgi:hypothetical protein
MTQPDYCALCRLCGQGLQAAADRLGRHLAEDHDIPAGTHGLTWSVTTARQGVDQQQGRLGRYHSPPGDRRGCGPRS